MNKIEYSNELEAMLVRLSKVYDFIEFYKESTYKLSEHELEILSLNILREMDVRMAVLRLEKNSRFKRLLK